jgi:serpin B
VKWALPLLALATVAGCGGETPGEDTVAAPTADQVKATAALAPARDKFAFKLKDQLLKEHPSGNLCFSPLSIQLCLSTLLNGTGGDSTSALRETLALDKEDLATFNNSNFSLVSALSGNSFTCANSIWLLAGEKPKPAFQDTLHEFYRAEFFSVKDFGAGTLKQVNDWVDDKTKSRIPRLFENFEPETCLVLVNALTFDGKWASRFDKEATKPEPFKLEDGKIAEVPTMHLVQQLAYGRKDGVESLKLDYVGGKFSMLFILPPADISATQFLAGLKLEQIRALFSNVGKMDVSATIPKFTSHGYYSLNKTLAAMGMAPLFSRVDLSGIGDGLGKGTRVTQTVHKTYLKVDEDGTEAAAATGVVLEKGDNGPRAFVANRPFIYALIHNETQAMVFLGVVNDPRG